MDVSKAAAELRLLKLAVNRMVADFTARSGVVVRIDVRPDWRKDLTFDAETDSLHRLIGYSVTSEVEALTHRKAAG